MSPSIRVILFPPGSRVDKYQTAWGYEAELQIDLESAHLLPREVAEEIRAVPVGRQGQVVTVATTRPDNPAVSERVRQLTGLRARAVAACEAEIERVLRAVYVTA